MQQPYLFSLLVVFIVFANPVPVKAQHGSANSPLTLLKTDSLNYLSFEFSEGKLFVLADLARSYQRNYLLVMDEKGSLQASLQLPGNYTAMHLSCDQKIFVGDKDSVSQVYVKNDSVFFGRSVAVGKLLAFMRDCLLMADGVVFRQKESPENIRSLLYAYYRDEHDKNMEALVFEVSDTLALERYEMVEVKKNRHSRIWQPTGRPGSQTRASVNYSEDQARSRSAYKSMPVTKQNLASRYHVPVNMLVNYHNENFYVLDYTNGCIAMINRFLSERKMVNLEYFTREMDLHGFSCDQATGDFYCFEGLGNTTPLRRYNHQTGKLSYSKPLPDLHETKNVRIYNQRLYYLLKPDKNKPSSTALMSVDLF